MSEKKYHIYLISDSTGETVSSVSRSVMSLFDDIEYREHLYSLIRTENQLEKVLEIVKEKPGIILYTVVNTKLRRIIEKEAIKIGVPSVPVITRTVRAMSEYFGKEVHIGTGRQHKLDEEYFERMEAINFALNQDDGQGTENLEEADVVLVGPSRTSKTPTCIYLSYRGIFAANVPFVKNCPLPENLFKLNNPVIIGLTISPKRLLQIRKSRLESLNESRNTSYIDIEKIEDEIKEARKLFSKQKWPVIDVTGKSVEETSATIMNIYNNTILKRS